VLEALLKDYNKKFPDWIENAGKKTTKNPL
jgi:hypothetical protein